jgi:hypothetical protein
MSWRTVAWSAVAQQWSGVASHVASNNDGRSVNVVAGARNDLYRTRGWLSARRCWAALGHTIVCPCSIKWPSRVRNKR